MRLGEGPPNEALARELRQVAVAAEALATTLKQVNNVVLPEGFPRDSMLDLCEALEGLPDGTAEGCRIDLEFARSFLPKVRRGFFADADDNRVPDDDTPPPLEREGALDLRLSSLFSAVGTALDEYRFQAQEAVRRPRRGRSAAARRTGDARLR